MQALDHKHSPNNSDAFIFDKDNPFEKHLLWQAIEEQKRPQAQLLLKIFAQQYFFFVESFTRCLAGLISKTEKSTHRRFLLDNLREEIGPSEQKSHFNLYTEFLKELNAIPHSPNRSTFLLVSEMVKLTCESPIQVGIGALGLAGECLMNPLNSKIYQLLKNNFSLSEQALVFFSLHSEVDLEHGQAMQEIAAELNKNHSDLCLLKKGYQESIRLRLEFFDGILEQWNKHEY